jgi:hypothetical protein
MYVALTVIRIRAELVENKIHDVVMDWNCIPLSPYIVLKQACYLVG